MKRHVILAFALILLPLTVCNAQESVETIIRKSREKCQSIQGGHYVMERKMKHMDDKDTDYYRNTCCFRKLPDDTIFGKAFSIASAIRPATCSSKFEGSCISRATSW